MVIPQLDIILLAACASLNDGSDSAACSLWCKLWPPAISLIVGFLLGTLAAITKGRSDFKCAEEDKTDANGNRRSTPNYPTHRGWATFWSGALAVGCVPLFLSLSKSSLIESWTTAADLLVLVGFAGIAAYSSRLFIDSVSRRALQQSKEAQANSEEAKQASSQAMEQAALAGKKVASAQAEAVRAAIERLERNEMLTAARTEIRELCDRGNFAGARTECERVLEKFGRSAVDISNLASVASYALDPTDTRPLAAIPLEQFDEVFSLFKEAIDLDPKCAEALYNRGCSRNCYRRAAKAQGKPERFVDPDIIGDIVGACTIRETLWDDALNDPDLAEIHEALVNSRKAAKGG